MISVDEVDHVVLQVVEARPQVPVGKPVENIADVGLRFVCLFPPLKEMFSVIMFLNELAFSFWHHSFHICGNKNFAVASPRVKAARRT